jgi:phage-related protein
MLSLRACHKVSDLGQSEDVKLAKFDAAARDALRAFPEDVRRAFGKAIYDLQLGHTLAMPLSRAMPTLGADAAELRIRDADGIYRAFYVVKVADAVLIFHAFAKKTEKTPGKEIELGKTRLKEML